MLTKTQARKKAEWVRRQLQKLESRPEIQQYKEWLKLPFSERQRLEEEWEAFYRGVKKTPAYRVYRIAKEALCSGDERALEKLRQCAENARQRLEARDFLTPPVFPDPKWFEAGDIFRRYRWLQEQLKKAEEALEDVELF